MVILWSDIRHALRTLLKSPGFSLVAVVSLALAIGATTTVFSLLNSILLRKLPVPHPDQLVQIFTIASSGQTSQVTVPAFREIESSQQVFSSMFCWWDDAVLSVDGGHGVTKSGVWGVSGLGIIT